MPADATTIKAARLALASGDPKAIAAAVAANPDITERAAIMEIDGGMTGVAANLAALQDFLGDLV